MRHILPLLAGLLPGCLVLTTASAPIALSTALNNSNLVWTTSANFPWFGTNDLTFDGISAASTGNRFQPSSISWLQTTVVGPGTLGFWWRVSSEAPDGLEFYIGDALQASLNGSVDWTYQTYALPPGSNTLTWQYVKDDLYNAGTDRGWLDQVTWVTGAAAPLQQALNTCGVTWLSTGNTNPTYWTAQTNVTHDGSLAAQSGPIHNLQQSVLQTTVSGVTNVSFWWRLSSESLYDSRKRTTTILDTLGFYVDGLLKTNIDLEEQWQQQSFALPPGSHTLQWIYAKDAADTLPKGQDCGWVDQVLLSPPPTALPYTLSTPAPQSNSQVQLTVTGEAGCPCQLQASTNSSTWTTLTNFITTGTTTTITDPALPSSPVRLYRALSR